jgi:DNA-3-methyladenine glycosylase
VGRGGRRLTAAGERRDLSPLPRDFFARPAQEMAAELLGCVLSHSTPDGVVAVRLTEVEAYAGAVDAASHAYRGRTARNAVMFGEPGHAYEYFTYGMHFCVNLVCLPAGTASAVLLRAGEVIEGEGLARRRRAPISHGAPDTPPRPAPSGKKALASRDLARGPARLCVALGIDRVLDGADVCSSESPLRILPPSVPSPNEVIAGPRVGIREGADVPWRFWLAGEPTVSVYRAHVPRRTQV